MIHSSKGEPPAVDPLVGRLRIAVLNRVFSPTGGGAERYSIALVEQLAAHHEMHVFTQEIDHTWSGVTYHLIPILMRKPRWVNQLWFAAATWLATRRGFDVVHSHESTWHGDVQTVHVLPLRYSLFVGRSGLRLILRYVKVATSPRLLAYLGLEASRFSPRPLRCVIATSPALKAILAATYPRIENALDVIVPGVNLPSLPLNRSAARRALSLPEHVRLIAFVANDYQKKGLGTLIEALKQLPPDVELAVVGNPSYIDRFRRKARELGLVDRVHFLGHLADVAPLYVAADVLAHPTLEDTFAMVVLEAMAYCLPIVVSGARYCGISGLLTNGDNALILASPLDVEELAGSLFQVLSNPDLHKKLSLASRQFAAAWSWPTIARQQEAMYRHISHASGARKFN